MTEQPMDVGEWFVDGAWYRLPDRTIVRATLEERDDALRWILRDSQGQRRFIFLDDGRVRAYVREQVLDRGEPASHAAPMIRISMAPCDLVVEDLQRVTGPDG